MTSFAITQFCDDIRHEVGNKFSLMSIYGNDLYLDEMPAVLSKICASIVFGTPIDAPPRNVAIRILWEDNVISETVPSEEWLQHSYETSAALKAQTASNVMSALLCVNMVVAPLVVEKEGLLQTTVIADGIEIPAGKLWIKLVPKS